MAFGNIDHAMQQNAALVEELNAACGFGALYRRTPPPDDNSAPSNLTTTLCPKRMTDRAAAA